MYNINNALKKIDLNGLSATKNILLQEYPQLDYKDELGNSLYHIIIKINGSISSKKAAIITLLDNGINCNSLNIFNKDFINVGLDKKNIDASFLCWLITILYGYGYNYNSSDKSGKSIIYYIFRNYNTDTDIYMVINKLVSVNFNFINIKENIIDTIKYEYTGNNSSDIIKYMQNIINNNIKINTNNYDSNSSNYNIHNMGSILNNKCYTFEPVIGRNKELEKLMVILSSQVKIPILVGESGVGKTSIVDELAYLIINNKVPDYLKNRSILEITANELVSGTKYRGDFEEKASKLFNYCTRNNIILFIDEIHTIYGTGTVENNQSNDLSAILKHYIDRENLRVIGATTKNEYDKYMANDALKRRFNLINVEELNDDILSKVIIFIINNLSISYNISIDSIEEYLDLIVSILLDLTNMKNRVYNDIVYNPDLVKSIIDESFSYAVYYSDSELRIEYIIKAINNSSRIYEYSKTSAINNLINIDKCKEILVRKKTPQIIEFPNK